MPMVQLANKVIEVKKMKADVVLLSDIYDLSVDVLTLLGNSVYEFSMKCCEMLKPEVAPAYKSLCHESRPITTLLFGDELPQSIQNISQVKHMAARSTSCDCCRSSSSVYTNFKKPCIESSPGRQFVIYGRSSFKFKCRYKYRKPPYQQ